VVEDVVIRPVSGTVLESISAKVVGELCRQVGLRCEEAPLDLRCFCSPINPESEEAVIARCSELLLTGTGFCLAGVRRFSFKAQGRDYNWPGPVFRKLLAAWSELVNVDIAKQFATE
jgi:hypothetical protein